MNTLEEDRDIHDPACFGLRAKIANLKRDISEVPQVIMDFATQATNLAGNVLNDAERLSAAYGTPKEFSKVDLAPSGLQHQHQLQDYVAQSNWKSQSPHANTPHESERRSSLRSICKSKREQGQSGYHHDIVIQ